MKLFLVLCFLAVGCYPLASGSEVSKEFESLTEWRGNLSKRMGNLRSLLLLSLAMGDPETTKPLEKTYDQMMEQLKEMAKASSFASSSDLIKSEQTLSDMAFNKLNAPYAKETCRFEGQTFDCVYQLIKANFDN